MLKMVYLCSNPDKVIHGICMWIIGIKKKKSTTNLTLNKFTLGPEEKPSAIGVQEPEPSQHTTLASASNLNLHPTA